MVIAAQLEKRDVTSLIMRRQWKMDLRDRGSLHEGQTGQTRPGKQENELLAVFDWENALLSAIRMGRGTCVVCSDD